MSHNNVINEKRKALLAYKEKILDEIKCYERSIDDFHTNNKSNSLYEEADSSDSEDDFPYTVDSGPSISELKAQQAIMKTCLQATQELTSLTVLQSEVNVLVEEPKFESERPVKEDGTWREITAECRIDLVPFTVNFYMHTPLRKFAPPSYCGLRVVPVKSAHELELAKSVLPALKLPSDVVEVLKSYAAASRSRRTTLAALAKRYGNALFMEPHAEGGFVLKCADLLEVSWRLENKWSPVAPFHHRMKFDLEYIDESYIKIITQAHKQLLDPALQTDERTLLLAKIISTCLEAKGTVDPESDLESKTTERDTDIEKKDSETLKSDREVMAPPKSLPKKIKQKNKSSLPNIPQKRSMNNDDGDNVAKKIRNSDLPSAGLRNSGDSNRKRTINDLVNESAKKRKANEVETKKKVAGNKNAKETDNTENVQPKNFKDVKNIDAVTKNKNIKETLKTKTKNLKDTRDIGIKDVNTEPEKEIQSGNKNKKPVNQTKNAKTKNDKEAVKAKVKTVKDIDNIEIINTHNKPENIKDKNKKPVNTKAKNLKETGYTNDEDDNTKSKNKNVKGTRDTEKAIPMAEDGDKDKNNKNDGNEQAKTNIKSKTKINKEPRNVGKISNCETKSIVSKGDDPEKNKQSNNIDNKIPKKVTNVPSKENIDANRITEKVSTKDFDSKTKNTDKNSIVVKTKNIDANLNKVKTVTKSKENNVAKPKNDKEIVKDSGKNMKSKENSVKNLKEKLNINSNTVKKVVEKHATNKIKDKISPMINKDSKTTLNSEEIPDVALNQNLGTKKNIENVIHKKPIKITTLKMPSHRTALKVQNPQKSFKPGNTKILSSGNTAKENGGKVSKIPQKRLSPFSDRSSKKNLRISPRTLPSKFKSQTNTFKQVLMKTTSIPRLLKKPAPKTAQ